MDTKKITLELAKLAYVLVMGCVLFLFFALLLDAFCVMAFGGWNPLLGSWPIFSGTVSAGLYSPVGSVVSLLIGLMLMARVMLGDRTPGLLLFLTKENVGTNREF